MAQRSIDAGARLRTEVVAARLSPKVKYGLDLLARLHRRSIAQTVEWAVYRVVMEQDQPDAPSGAGIGKLLEELWSPSPSERLELLASKRPDLMTYEDELLWRKIRRARAFWHLPSPPPDLPEQDFSVLPGATLLHDVTDAAWDDLGHSITEETPGSRGPRQRRRGKEKSADQAQSSEIEEAVAWLRNEDPASKK